MINKISALLLLTFALLHTSCESNDDIVYVKSIQGYWERRDIAFNIRTSNAEADRLLLAYYLTIGAEYNDNILFFGEKSVFKSYRDAKDENPEESIYTINGSRIAIGGIQGLCKVRVVQDTMWIDYNETPYVTPEGLIEDLNEAGYTSSDPVQLLTKTYNWRFIRIDDPFITTEDEN